METLRLGSKGQDVTNWQFWLRGQGLAVTVDGDFGPATAAATKTWQWDHNLRSDGVVGNSTLAAALAAGFAMVEDTGYDPDDKNSPAWPPRPPGASPLSYADKIKLFGVFRYEPAPTANDPDAIRILDNWAPNNLIFVKIPQLVKVPHRAPANGRILVNKKIAYQLQQAFEEIESAGLLSKIVSFDGAAVTRFIRGLAAKGVLSNHSWGTAIDLNADFNKFHQRPALVGSLGSVREIVMIMYKWGFYWLGWGSDEKKLDGMHFEAYKIIEDPLAKK